MEHHLKIVASNFQLDEKKLTDFALKNKSKYGIVDDNGFVTTTTSFSQKLVDDFKAQSVTIKCEHCGEDCDRLHRNNSGEKWICPPCYIGQNCFPTPQTKWATDK